ncbi:low temperature requirement protein A [Agrococcus citreus]|uniref:Low temperature requirement protein A n=1 Tax=Agrococcus citreus TaxID=84643 RepID=A0ABN1YTZ0_9MICO
MSMSNHAGARDGDGPEVVPAAEAGRFRLLQMRPRDPEEAGRSATPLELFFDLVFVVAVSIASVNLHHALGEGHVVEGLLVYGVIFFGIWWAWINSTWFATSFATDDWLYRLLTFVQMGGVLVLAAGVAPAFEEQDFSLLIFSYVVMRVAMVAQWLRASRWAGESRRATQLYAVGISAVQALWLLSLLLPEPVSFIAIGVLILAELAVPIVAERQGETPWHPHHLTERFGLFTLILLGESLLASANAVIVAIEEVDELGPLLWIATLALVVTCALWWIYFWSPHHRLITDYASSVRHGYAHFFVFAAAGALSAGIEVEIDVLTETSALDPLTASFTVTVPIAVFVMGIWGIALRHQRDRVVNTVVPLGALLVLLDPLLPFPVAVSAIILAIVVLVLVVRAPDEAHEHARLE